MLWAIAGTVRRPNATFREISHDPGRYLASSVAILAILCAGSVLRSVVAWFEPDSSSIINDFDNGIPSYVILLINVALYNLLIIAAIFWIGCLCGANRKFKDMFPVLSYCLIPMVFFAVASSGLQLIDLSEYVRGGGYYVGGGSLDPDPDLSPSYGLDFAGGFFIHLIYNIFPVFFMIWAFVLFVKATKISRGFGTGKAVGVVALAVAVTYVLAIFGGFFLQSLLPLSA